MYQTCILAQRYWKKECERNRPVHRFPFLYLYWMSPMMTPAPQWPDFDLYLVWTVRVNNVLPTCRICPRTVKMPKLGRSMNLRCRWSRLQHGCGHRRILLDAREHTHIYGQFSQKEPPRAAAFPSAPHMTLQACLWWLNDADGPWARWVSWKTP